MGVRAGAGRGIAVLLCAILLSFFIAGSAARAEKRVAMVIGNGAYRSVPALPNPPNDAKDVAGAFERLGFAVRVLTDATYDGMRRGLLEFGRQARDADVAVVYFAGHGIEVGGENWLIPIDAELRSDIDVDHEAMGLRSVLPAVESAGKLGLVILDACRNNPFAAKMQRSIRTRAVSRGLVGIEPSGNVLVAYAAKDGTTAADGAGRNSPFTASLLKHLETPGLEVNFLFRNVRDDVISATRRQQQPFVYGSLSKEAIYLKSPVALPPLPPVPAPDEVTWGLLKDTSDPAAVQRFIAQFPDSPLRPQAETRIAALTAEAATAAAARAEETAWGLLQGTNDAASLRRFLEQFPRTPRRAQAEQRIAVISAQQHTAAREMEQKMAALAEEARQAKARPSGPAPEDVAWSLVKDSKDPDQFRLFVEQFPNSAHRAQAEQRTAALAAEQRAAAAALEQRMAALRTEAESAKLPATAPDSREVARTLQLELKRIGCFEGAINGDFGPPSRDALRKFARLAAVSLPDDEPSNDMLSIIRRFEKRVCPLSCKAGERAEEDRCIRIVCPANQVLKDGACVAKPGAEPKKRLTQTPENAPRAKRPAAAGAPARGGGKCFTFQGRSFCE